MVDRLFSRERADSLRAPGPDRIARQDPINLRQSLWECAGEFTQFFNESIWNVGHEATDAGETRRQARAGPHFLQIINLFALLERPEKRRKGAQVDRCRPQPHHVRDDAAHLARDDAQHGAPRRDLDAHQRFCGERESDVVRHR